MELNDDGYQDCKVLTVYLHRQLIATFTNYLLFKCLTTKELGLVGMFLKLVLSKINLFMIWLKAFCSVSVGKGEVEAKPETKEAKKEFSL